MLQTSNFAADFPEFVLKLDSVRSAASSAGRRNERQLAAHFFNCDTEYGLTVSAVFAIAALSKPSSL